MGSFRRAMTYLPRDQRASAEVLETNIGSHRLFDSGFGGQFGVSSSGGQFGVSSSMAGQFGVSSSLLLPLHQVGKLDSWEDFQDRQAMTLFTTRSTAGTTEPMSSAPTANGICSLAISPAPRHGILSALRLLLDVQPFIICSRRAARGQFGVSSSLLLPMGGQFGVSSSLLLPLHQVGKLDSWEDFQDRQAMTLFTTRSTAGTTEPMSSAPTANGICSLAISPAPRHGILSRSSATA